MSEDKLTMWEIERWQQSDFHERHYTEVHYNHYGTRGVVDLVVVEDHPDGPGATTHVFEMKSDEAIRSATGANEILRQFNKQQSFFEKGIVDSEITIDNVKHQLVFAASSFTVQHVLDNISLYGNPNQSGSIIIREVGEATPAIVSGGRILVGHGVEWMRQYADLDNEKIDDYTGGSDE